jgi:hypothetical protein
VFLNFYIPLAMTSLLTMLSNPIGSAGLSRMPLPKSSMAAWTVATGLVFLMRALGIAYNEVVVALLDERGSQPSLRRFTGLLAAGASAGMLLVTATPIADLWLLKVQGITPELARLAHGALWIGLPIPALNAIQSWFQGKILHSRRTRGITEAIVAALLANITVLAAGVIYGRITGIYVAMAALLAGMFAQTGWLWLRSRLVQ